jgi:ArsR family transcriptional regulator
VDADMDRTEKVFKALADGNRLKILKLLEVKPLCVCELTFLLEIAQSTVSEHLKILKDVGLIEAKKNGLFTDYLIVVKPKTVLLKKILDVIKESLDNREIRALKDRAKKVNRKFLISRNK